MQARKCVHVYLVIVEHICY